MNDELETIGSTERDESIAPEVHSRRSSPLPDGEKSASPRLPDPSSATPAPRRPTPDDDDDDEDESFFRKYRAAIIGGILVLGIGGWMATRKPSGPSAPARKAPEPMVIRIQPLPPPPPPPPPKIQPPQPKDEKLPEQAPMAAPDKKPEDAKPKPVDKPPEGLGTNIKGPGQGLAGLGGGSGNGMIGGTGNGPGGGGSAAAWYAGQVQSKVSDALRNHAKTRNASFRSIKISVSIDATGRVTSARILTPTGQAGLDEAIQNEALNGIRLQEPPPGGKPMTVTMVLNAKRPK